MFPMRNTILIITLILLAFSSLHFATKSYRTWQVLNSARSLGQGELAHLRAWLSLAEVVPSPGISSVDLIHLLALPPAMDTGTRLATLAGTQGRESRAAKLRLPVVFWLSYRYF